MRFTRQLRLKLHDVTHRRSHSHSDPHNSISPSATPQNLESEPPEPSQTASAPITLSSGPNLNSHSSADEQNQPPSFLYAPDLDQNNRQWTSQPPVASTGSNAPVHFSRDAVQHELRDPPGPQGSSLHSHSRSNPHSKPCKMRSNALVPQSKYKSDSSSNSNSQGHSTTCEDVTPPPATTRNTLDLQNAGPLSQSSDEELVFRFRPHPSSMAKFSVATSTVHHHLTRSGSGPGSCPSENQASAPNKFGRPRSGSAPSFMPTTTAGRHRELETRDDNVAYKCSTCGHTNACSRSKKGFRCGKCAMINDLQAYKGRAKTDPSENNHGNPLPWNRVAPVSLQVTRSIIDKCLQTYFQHMLHGVDCGEGQKSLSAPVNSNLTVFTRSPQDLNDREPSLEIGTNACSTRSSPPTVSQVKHPVKASSECSRRYSDSNPPSNQNSEKGERKHYVAQIDDRHETQHVTLSFSRHRSSVIFRPLTGYLNSSFNGCDTLNCSFLTAKSGPFNAESSEKSRWGVFVSANSPRIDWNGVDQWYDKLINVSAGWEKVWYEMKPEEADPLRQRWEEVNKSVGVLKRELRQATMDLRITLLMETESLLVRPQRLLKTPDDMRFLMILLANPLLKPNGPALTTHDRASGNTHHDETNRPIKRILGILAHLDRECHHVLRSWFSRYDEQRMRITIETIGRFLTSRLARLNQRKPLKAKQGRSQGHVGRPGPRTRGRSGSNPTGDGNALGNVVGTSTMDALVPTLSVENATPAQIHEAINRVATSSSSSARGRGLASSEIQEIPAYVDDWQIHVAAIVMSILFSANSRTSSSSRSPFPEVSAGGAKKHHAFGNNIVPISTFYNTLLDYSDVIGDFEAWEAHSRRFTFCQYPFFLSLLAKIRILEYDARRQMAEMARQAFFKTIFSGRTESQYIVLKVRRECLVEDSLAGVAEVVSSGGHDLKKGLRIEFDKEAGIDAGGLRKEWFLMLTRDIFNPLHGMFIYDEDSQYCYFNPHCLESSQQFYLVGILLGLAIYNSTILDIALPPFLFRKLIANMPIGPKSSGAGTAPTSARTRAFRPTLLDLAEFRPALARGLQKLLEFDGNVKDAFYLEFMIDVERFGEHTRVPLCPQGDKRAVTNHNRQEYVDLYVKYILDDSVAQQFDPFRAGFFTVCGGNSLHLFSSEEIELLVRGSGGNDSLDVPSLRAVAVYDNWHGVNNPATEEPVVRWFWEFFERSSPKEQRQILSFITGSDRIPAMGATNLVIRIACLGEAGVVPNNSADSAVRGKTTTERFPTARTCFNMLGLWRYSDGPEERKRFEEKLWRAVVEGEGFGLK